MKHRMTLGLLMLASALLAAGCGAPTPQIAEVEGTVKVRGKPLSRLMVRFVPDPNKGNDWAANATGQTDEQGKFQLKYVYLGKEGLGAAVGWNRVVIEDTRGSGVPQGQPRPPQIIPLAYSNSSTTPLSKEVKPGKQTIDLEVSN